MADSHTQEVLSVPKVDGVKLPPRRQEISHDLVINDYLVNQPLLERHTYSQAFPKGSLPQWQIRLQQNQRGVVVTLMLSEAVKNRSAVAHCSFKFIDDNGDVIHETTHMERPFHIGRMSPLELLFIAIGTGGEMPAEEFEELEYSETFSNVPSLLTQSGKLIIRADITYRGKVVILRPSVFARLCNWWKGTKKT